MTLKYTKAIKNGRLNTTQMEVGESVSGVVTGTLDGKYGTPALKIQIGNSSVIVNPSGNLKFVAKDYAEGKKALGTALTFTRTADKTFNGRATSSFDVLSTSGNNANADIANNTVSVKDKLEAIRAKRAGTQNG